MAIITETFELGGRQFVRTYSDAGRYVVGGEPYGKYAEACDPADLNRTYVEGDFIEDGEQESEELAAKAEAYDILMGVSE